MGTSKRYSYSYEEYGDGDKSAKTMVPDILNDPELPKLDEIVIGCWGEAYEESIQTVIDDMIENKDKFAHIRSFSFADMDYEECEVSWIIQGDYSKLWEAFPNMKKLIIKGSEHLVLGNINHANLEYFEIICGGMPKTVLSSVQTAILPSLNSLILYLGDSGYGFDGNGDTIKEFLAKSDFQSLNYLGMVDSEIQDEVVKITLESKYAAKVETLDFSYGTLTDEGGKILLEGTTPLKNLKHLILKYNFLTEDMAGKLEQMDLDVNTEERNEIDEYGPYPMLGE